MKGWRKIFHANGNQKRAKVAILISDKKDSKSKTVTRDKECHHTLIKWSIKREDIIIINTYTPSIRAPKYVYKTGTDRPEGRKSQQYNNIRGLQYSIFNNGYNIQKENQ